MGAPQIALTSTVFTCLLVNTAHLCLERGRCLRLFLRLLWGIQAAVARGAETGNAEHGGKEGRWREGTVRAGDQLPLQFRLHLIIRNPCLPHLQIVSRKRTTEKASDYEGLMDKTAALILAACQKMGLLQPGGTLPPGSIFRYPVEREQISSFLSQPAHLLPPASGLSSELDADGSLGEFGQRLCGVLVSLGEEHFKCLSGEERRNMYLQQMLVFSRHPSLQLSALSLPLWACLLRDALPHVCGGTTLSPATAAAAVRTGEAHVPAAESAAVSTAAALAAAAASGGPLIRPALISIPPECCQVSGRERSLLSPEGLFLCTRTSS